MSLCILSAMVKDSIFQKSTTLISTILAVLGAAGIYFKPENRPFIFTVVFILISGVLIVEKMNQIDKNTENIKKLNEKLKIEQRINNIEKELEKQEIKISMRQRP